MISVPKGSHQGKWTDERFAAASDMWKRGKSAREIAIALDCGFSRNSIVGKMHRSGVATGSPQHGTSNLAARQAGGLRAVKLAPKPKAPRNALHSASTPRPPRPYRPAPAVPIDLSHAKPWEARQSNECAWIIDDSPSISLACCAPVCEAGRPHQWCEGHTGAGLGVAYMQRLAGAVR